MSIPEQAGKVATSTVEAFRSQPGLLFLTLVNLGFLIFTYFTGALVKAAYDEQQEQINERYKMALTTVDRCIEIAFSSMSATAKTAVEQPTYQLPPGTTLPAPQKGSVK